MTFTITITDILINPIHQPIVLCNNTLVCCGFGGHRSVEVFYGSVTIFDPDVVGGSGGLHVPPLITLLL